jgi:DNA polymerase III alpha subunit
MTDHGNVFGAYDFWKKAKAHGVKPIIGTEAYVAPAAASTSRACGGATAARTTSRAAAPTPT